jgi:NifB/MoaA-like Fe-S oxidoreductase
MTYPTSARPAAGGGYVQSVERSGAAARAGIAPGDLIVEAAGHRLRDVIDWMWQADGTDVSVKLTTRDGETRVVTLERGFDEGWGFEFEDVVFDGIRECDNACAFCFVGQLPPGLRPSLYVRDDDFRLSFLVGNFVTLTNLDDDDVERILLAAVRLRPRRGSRCPAQSDLRHRRGPGTRAYRPAAGGWHPPAHADRARSRGQ